MASDVSAVAALIRGVDLQTRLQNSAHSVLRRTGAQAKASSLFREIRGYLQKASDKKFIRESPHLIYENLKLTRLEDGMFDISVGDVRNFRRDLNLPHFTRADGGWFDFQLLIREGASELEVVAYDFELRLPGGGQISFLRFDVNPPGHDNESKSLRAHVHLNSDDDGFSVPAPILSPFEVFDVFIFGVQSTGRVRRIERTLLQG
uniref:hypothetical protein n=1 Tax=Corallococcus coralloides TaxID=184914 RepID=UPI0013E8A75A|nr:hypothetical protein [Corallococcus coralloides]